jgi:hypothetical protein
MKKAKAKAEAKNRVKAKAEAEAKELIRSEGYRMKSLIF